MGICIPIAAGTSKSCEFPGYALAGVGEYLGHYLIRSHYAGAGSTLDEVCAIAITSLGVIKEYDDACGGATELVVMRKDGSLKPIARLDVSQVEDLTDRFIRASNELWTAISKPIISQKDLDASLSNFSSDVEDAIKEGRSSRQLLDILAQFGSDKALKVRRSVLTKARSSRSSTS